MKIFREICRKLSIGGTAFYLGRLLSDNEPSKYFLPVIIILVIFSIKTES